ncbi:MAG: hypothetical protein K5839_06740 [Treponemataceae bacterium]|nr:hypothetical protein [Treponemataceae bacterium]
MEEDLIEGRKTFFLAPDKSLLPQSYLEEYLALGYECYFIDTDIFVPLEKKVDIIISVFKDSILFFNIDAPIQNGESWPIFLSRIKEKYPDHLFGVTFAKRKTLAEVQYIDRVYRQKIGLQCGGIQLEYQKNKNFGIVENALLNIKAMGRRKSVRAYCQGSCSFKFTNNNNEIISVKLNDISLSHFSFTVESGRELYITEFSKLIDTNLLIHGVHIITDVVLAMKRNTPSGDLYVFAFCNKQGKVGLDQYNRPAMCTKIYAMLVENCSNLLGDLFREAQKERFVNNENNEDNEEVPLARV